MFILSYHGFANAYRRLAAQTPAALFETLGWQPPTQASAPPHNSTLLTSLALLSQGVAHNGEHPIASGPLAGTRASTSGNRLARWLADHRGPPEIYPGGSELAASAEQLFGQRGILAFIQPTGPHGGSLHLLDGHNAARCCRQSRHHHPAALHFWRLR